MSLEDVIKKKRPNEGSRSGGGGSGGGRSRRAGRAKAGASGVGVQRIAGKEAKAKASGQESGMAPRRRLAGARSFAAIGMAAKAAAAAAKATATKAPLATSAAVATATKIAAERPLRQTERKAPALKQPRSSLKFREKLQMSLDDVIKTDVKRRPDKAAGGGERAKVSSEVASEGRSKRGGRRKRIVRLRREDARRKVAPQPAKAKAKAKARGGRKVRAGGRRAGAASARDDAGDGTWVRRAQPPATGSNRAWAAWDDRASGGMYADWDLGPRRRISDDNFQAAKRRKIAEGPAGWERGAAPRPARRPASGRDEQWPGGGGLRSTAGWGPGRGALGRGFEDEEAREKPGSPRRAAVKSGEVRIRVSNIPRNLDRRDIMEAFEDSGRVVRCELDRGTAFVTFANATDAKKAAQTFDRGELNGQTILVAID